MTSDENSVNDAGGENLGRPARRFQPHRKKRERGMVKADINVTPLVDVVLVLLIIFMVVTPMLSGGVAVDLPITRNHDKKADDGKDIIVSVTKDGSIYVGADLVVIEKLAGRVEAEKRHFPDKVIFLKGDRLAHYGKAREAMEAIHTLGIDDIELGTDEPKEAK